MSDTDLCQPAVAAGTAGGDCGGDALLADIIAATDGGIDLETYLELRNLGGDHDGISELLGRGCPTHYIRMALRVGATCAELIELGSPWRRVNHYYRIRRTGMSHKATLEILDLGIDAHDYASALRGGITPAELIEFVTKCPLPNEYVNARGWGVPHSDLVDGASLGITPEMHSLAARKRLPYAELAQAVREGANPLLYIENSPKRD
jgi:hypothetical protein